MVWVGLIAIAGLLLVVMVSASMLRERPRRPAEGKPLAIVDLPVLIGEGETLSTDSLRGQVVLINFWGPWCPPCIREMPELVALQEKYAGHEDFRLLFVSCSTEYVPLLPPAMGWGEDVDALRSDTQRLIDRDGHNVKVYCDPRGRTRDALAGINGWHGYPTTVLLDREGVIRRVWLGNLPGAVEEMETHVRLLLTQ